MKYALIGCGMIAPNHIKAALETGLEISALCDVNEAAARKILETIPEEKRAGTGRSIYRRSKKTGACRNTRKKK